MQQLKVIFGRFLLKNTLVLVIVVTAIGDAVNYEAAMLYNDYSYANVAISIIVFIAWCFFFYVNSFYGSMSKEKMLKVTAFLLTLAILIILAYVLNNFDFLYSISAALMAIPSYLIMVPLIGIEMPIWKFIERDLVCFSFLPFFICIVFIVTLLFLNVVLYYIGHKNSAQKKMNLKRCRCKEFIC